ncbi:uncharacterized protein [Onthophagus taurus]|uniref:uncharacterized protein n=1 Tax=Onthophagus taurus TaxID=166361 RepID=UPI000C20F2F8|nr:uncharacterized protein LOC111425999 [Onthophagus taurus]
MSTKLSVGVKNTLTLSVNDITSSVTSAAVSLKFVRKIIPLVIENIVYHRLDLEENLFEKKSVKDWDYMAFKAGIRNKHTTSVYWLCRSIAGAIAKKEIEKIFLFFTNKNNKESIEYYIFNLEYKDLMPEESVNGNTLLSHTKKIFEVLNSLSDNFSRLNPNEIEIIFEFKTLGPSSSVNVPYFTPLTSTGYSTKISKKATIPLGRLDTGYHRLRLDAGGMFEQQESQNDANNVASENDIKDIENLENTSPRGVKRKNGTPTRFGEPEFNSLSLLTPEANYLDTSFKSSGSKRPRKRSMSMDSMIRIIDEDISSKRYQENKSFNQTLCTEINLVTPPKQFNDIDITLSDDGIGDTNNSPTYLQPDEIRLDNTINCFCKLNYSLGLSRTLTCTICNRIMHTICVGYQNDENAPNNSYICLKCGEKEKPATDVKLARVKENDVVSLCLLRLVLRYYIVNKTLPKDLIEVIDLKVQEKLKINLRKIPGVKITNDNMLEIEKHYQFGQFMAGFFYDGFNIDLKTPDSMTL